MIFGLNGLLTTENLQMQFQILILCNSLPFMCWESVQYKQHFVFLEMYDFP